MKNKKSTETLLTSRKLVKMALLPSMLLMCFSVLAQEPQKPLIDSISIVDGHPFITWFPNNDNTEEYVIVRKEGNSPSFEIATIPGISSTSYHDIEVIACDKWYEYHVFASDEGQPDSEWSDGRRTIFLQQPVYDECENSITLNWTPYLKIIEFPPPPVQVFDHSNRVLVSTDGGITFTTLTETNAEELSFIHENLAPNTLYFYKILAFDSDGNINSSSCETSMLAETYAKPTFANILNVSVENNEYVKIDWEADQSAVISRYVIKRSDGIEFEIPDGTVTEYSDTSADFNSRSYDYSIVVYDSCDFEVLETSNIGRSIYLQWQPGNSGLAIKLNWNAYADWPGGVDSYNIYRKESDNFTQIESVGANETSYTDPDVSGLTETEGIFTYKVEAVEKNGNLAKSISNQVVVEMETKVLTPNAFIPEGLPPDNQFLPVTSFIDKETYELLVFNKWGQMIFNTTDPLEPWHGKFNGEYVPADAYVYRIRVKSPDGRDFQTQGTVTVIR